MKPKYKIGDAFNSSGGTLIAITGVDEYYDNYIGYMYTCLVGRREFESYKFHFCDNELDNFKKIEP